MPELELCVKNGKAILPSVDDVVLVTGGAKGITLECVRYLGMLCGCRFILLGRNNAENDALLANNLSSLSENRIHFEYFACDISDGKAVNELVATLRRKNRTITGMIHGAGVNVPKRTEDLRLEDIENTLRPKLYGLQNLMGSMELSTLKFCISFGSIIGALGMEGNGDYALANQWLENRMLDLARQHLNIYFLNIQWSVWGGTGMGQSLGVLERLKSKGIEPITLENGIRFLEGIFKHPPVANSIIATGRYGRFSLRGYCQPPGAGHYRFIQQVAVHYPQIELITECDLSSGIDLYLKDHAIDGNLMLPGVFSLEAIAQAAATLTGMEPSAVCMEDIEFLDPIIVKPHVSKKLRVIIQRIGVDRYSAVIREDSREFKKDAIRCKLHWGEQEPLIEVERPTGAVSSFEPSADLYDSVLFHKGVFERVKSYFSIEAYACMALATRDKTANYFSDFMPKNMLLGDPALNDSVLHALQVCVPDRILLPLAVHRLRFHTTRLLDEVIIRAKEVKQEGAEFVYDIRVTDQEGNLVQEWTGVRFHALHRKLPLELPARLAQVMLQRKTDALLGTRHQSFIKLDKDKSWEKTTKRTDGKPSANGYSLSRSYSGNVALSISSEHDIVCDAEMVIHQSDARWCTLLGEAHMQLVSNIQRETGEGRLLAATRVWCAVECIRKAGLQDSSPLLLERSEPDGTVYMHSAGHKVMTYNCSIKNEPVSSMFAVLIRN
jgi:enediyne polyketide synthase